MPMTSGLTAVIMTGGQDHTPAEQMVARAREIITCETVDKLLQGTSVERIIVATNSLALASMLADRPVTVDLDPPDEPFHFGRRLTQILHAYKVERCLYIGGGSGALLTAQGWEKIVRALTSADSMVIANNFYSTDFAAWTPANALEYTSSLDNDNGLTWVLHFDAGLPVQALPRSAATQLDVDTPIDVMTLSLHPDCGPHLRRYLEALKGEEKWGLVDVQIPLIPKAMRDAIHSLQHTLEQVLEVLLDREAEVFVAGRISAAAAAYLQSETLCRKRILVEERGMRASGRQARGEINSLLGVLLEDRGPHGFFEALNQMGEALILDSRVILAHRRSWPSTSDRFCSDLRQPEQIADPFLARFTAAALESSVPVVLGGHSLVSGGIWALVDAAWSRVEGQIPQRSEPSDEAQSDLL